MTRYRIVVVTGNVNKKREIELILSDFGESFEVLTEPSLRKLEIQADQVEDIARAAIENIARVVKPRSSTYIVVEDDGLYIEALGGFPGPYSEYVYRTIGLRGVLKLLEDVDNRRAVFKSALGVYTPSGKIEVVCGEVSGYIARELRGSGGFGYDPIFVPDGYDLTFAEMSLEEKCRVSHRARAFRELGKLILSGSLA